MCYLGGWKKQAVSDGYHGGFGCSEYVIKPYRSLFKLNQNMDPSEAAFVEPVGTVCQEFGNFVYSREKK